MPIFNPAENHNQVSYLRVVNTEVVAVDLLIQGLDDAGIPGEDVVALTLPALSSANLSSMDLEHGNAAKGLLGRLGDGDGAGKWRLTVSATGRITVQSLLLDTEGHLTNLSSLPDLSEAVPGERMLWLVLSASNAQQQSFSD